jgi:3-deoxy-D-manno-octulosonic-acid transferase
MRFLYTIGIRLYALLIRLASAFNGKAKKWVDGRKKFWNQLPDVDHSKKLLWFHCASLGEFDMALPIMSEIKKHFPESQLLVTFFSSSGMEHYHKREHQADIISYLPIDTPTNARRFIDHYKPQAVFFVKYEFWMNYILEAKRQGVKVYSVCTLFRESHRFFKWYGGFFRKTLGSIDFFYVQNQQSADLMEKIHLTNYLVVGDTRFDRVLANSKKAKSNQAIEKFLDGKKAWIFGSTWPADEAILKVLIEKYPTQKMIFAPHDISEAHIADIERFCNGNSCSVSQPESARQVLIMNTIGHLTDAYAYGELAYVGGGFSGKLHNILEPSVFGLPVIFGPKFERFPEAYDFIAQGIGFSVKDASDLQRVIVEIIDQLDSIQHLAIKNVVKNCGAADRICQNLSFS